MRIRKNSPTVTAEGQPVAKKERLVTTALKAAGAAAAVLGATVVLRQVAPAIAKSGFLKGDVGAKLGPAATKAKEVATQEFATMANHFRSNSTLITAQVADSLFNTVRTKSPAFLRQLAPHVEIDKNTVGDPIIQVAKFDRDVSLEDAASQMTRLADHFGKPVHGQFGLRPLEAQPNGDAVNSIEAWNAAKKPSHRLEVEAE